MLSRIVHYFQNTHLNLTCLRVISTVDYMVAAGSDQGVVTVFQIPKSLPASLPDSLKPKQKKQVKVGESTAQTIDLVFTPLIATIFLKTFLLFRLKGTTSEECTRVP